MAARSDQIDALQDVERPVGFVQSPDFDDWRIGCHVSADPFIPKV